MQRCVGPMTFLSWNHKYLTPCFQKSQALPISYWLVQVYVAAPVTKMNFGQNFAKKSKFSEFQLRRNRQTNVRTKGRRIFFFALVLGFCFSFFLDAPSHLYKRVCPSVGPSVRPSVGPSVPRYFQTRTRRILCRVSGLVFFFFLSFSFPPFQ